MDFETFKLGLSILEKDDSALLRERYIEKFVDIMSDTYVNDIQKKYKFSDGYCYIGYLWDYIREPIIIGEDYLISLVNNIDNIYVFWDIHSCERILIEDYWKFNKDDILRMKYKNLLEGEQYLPEDIYIFDDTMNWTIIKTHEDIDDQRYCLKSGDL